MVILGEGQNKKPKKMQKKFSESRFKAKKI